MSEQAMTSPWPQQPQPSPQPTLRLEALPLLRPPSGSGPAVVPKATLSTSHLLVPDRRREPLLQRFMRSRLAWKLYEHRGQIAMVAGVLAVSVAFGLIVATVLA
jgi:hypothetical protein